MGPYQALRDPHRAAVAQAVSQLELEDEAATFPGSVINAFGYQDGCVVILLGDGRQITIGAEGDRVWWSLNDPTFQ